MPNALFTYRKDIVSNTAFIGSEGNSSLFDKIHDRDIMPVISLGAETAFDGEYVATHEYSSDGVLKKLGKFSVEDVGMIVNRLDRSFKKDQLPSEWTKDAPAIANENEMRSLAFRKHRVQAEVFEPLGLGMPTKLLESENDSTDFMDLYPATHYILKPNSGTFSRGVRKMSGEMVASESMLGLPEKPTIIQPAYDFTAPFDPSIKPYDNKSTESFHAWSKSEVIKEIRMYAFHSPEQTSLFPVARAMQDGKDNWIFVDPDTVPSKLYESTRQVIEKSARLTGSRAIYAALDFGYGRLHFDDKNDYHAIELNAKMPYLIAHEKHADVADVLRDQFADMVYQTVKVK